MTVSVRAMRWWDLPRVTQLDQALFVRTAWSEETFWSELAGVPQSRWYVVAEADHDVIGFAGLAQQGSDADVQTIGVGHDHQNRGVGSTLLDALVTEALRRNVKQLFLEVASDNEVAQDIYGRHSFVAIDRRRNYYGEGVDAVIMRKRLDAAT